jgi:hypothetical protein
MNKTMNEATLKAFAVTMKIGLVATTDEQGDPHLTVLSTLQGKDDHTFFFVKLVLVLRMVFIQTRPQAGFLVMNSEKEFWYGRMEYTHQKKEGDDYVMYNNQPLYRYNSYFGINTVYYLNLIEVSDKNLLPMGEVIRNALKVLFAKHRFKSVKPFEVMKPWAAKFTAKLDTLKFITYLTLDGYPKIVPIIQAQSIGSHRIVVKNAPYTDLLNDLKPGQKVAILAFSMSMEDVLLKGTFGGFDAKGFGFMEIERIYNAMPPIHKYIYPTNTNPEIEFSENEPILR